METQKSELLVIQYQYNKCNKAFGELYNMNYNGLYNYIRKIVNNSDDAFDITQESFICAAKELDKLKDPGAFKFWLFRIAKHMCMKNFRNTARLSFESYNHRIHTQTYETDDILEKEQVLDKMASLLTTLSTEDQKLLDAKYCQGRSIKEIMKETHLGSSAIKMKLMRAREKVVLSMGA